MTDIRNIRESESEKFLQLLCDVFKLDFNRAYDVFYQEPLFDLSRKWALLEGNEIVAVLTTTPLEFGWGKAVGIAGVATHPDRQNEGFATRLIQKVLRESEKRGEGAALLFAQKFELYERCGFEPIDRVVRCSVTTAETDPPAESPSVQISMPHARALYGAWAAAHPDRLRRDLQRWRYWDWHNRFVTEFEDGYLCQEAGYLREGIFSTKPAALPVLGGTEWLGTALMTDELEIPFAGTLSVEMLLMGYKVPGIPQLFMTDQF